MTREVQLSIRMEAEMADGLKVMSAATGHTMGELCRQGIDAITWSYRLENFMRYVTDIAKTPEWLESALKRQLSIVERQAAEAEHLQRILKDQLRSLEQDRIESATGAVRRTLKGVKQAKEQRELV
jgi:hypothetical protein